MATITTLNSTDSGSASKTIINTNFSNLNSDKAESSTLTAHTAATTNAHGITGSFIGSTDTQTMTNKTLVTPTIASFANANHNHTNSAGGGQITDAALSSAVTASKGGTGQTSLTNNALLLGQGTSAVAFVAAGTSGYVLTANGTASAPTYQALTNPATFKNGQTTYDISTASGTQTIAHGLGTTPKYVRITAYVQGDAGTYSAIYSVGVYNGTTNSHIHVGHEGTASNFLAGGDSTNIVYLATSASANSAGICSVTSTNISIAWTKTGSPGGTAQMLWEAWA